LFGKWSKETGKRGAASKSGLSFALREKYREGPLRQNALLSKLMRNFPQKVGGGRTSRGSFLAGQWEEHREKTGKREREKKSGGNGTGNINGKQPSLPRSKGLRKSNGKNGPQWKPRRSRRNEQEKPPTRRILTDLPTSKKKKKTQTERDRKGHFVPLKANEGTGGEDPGTEPE